MDQFLVSDQSSLTLIPLLPKWFSINSCIFSLSFCKNLYFQLASVIIHTFARKKAGSFQPTTGENHNNENTWFPCLEQGLEVTSIHILLNFFGYIVKGSIGSLNMEKSTLGSEFRLSYALFTNNEPSTLVLCSSFKHLQPPLKNYPYTIAGLGQQKGGTATCRRKSPSKSSYFKERFLICHI